MVAPVPSIIDLLDNKDAVQGTITDGGFTDDPSPTAVISLSGLGAAVGDTISLYDNGIWIKDYVLKAADITAGQASITSPALINNSHNDFTATFTPDGGSESGHSNAWEFTIDQTNPIENSPTNIQEDWVPDGGDFVFGPTKAITVADNSGEPLTVTLFVSAGTLTLQGDTTGVTVTGDGTGIVTLVGESQNINIALENLLYHTTSTETDIGDVEDALVITTTDLAGNQATKTVTIDVICFMAGTMIRTPDGEVAVETLKRGDRVLTADGRTLPVSWLGRQTVSRLFGDRNRVLPIRIKAGALADGVPSRDLLISPDHAVLVDGALIQAGALVNGTSIVRETDVPAIFRYYHVEVEDHSLILAENTAAETFVDNVDRMRFDNWAEHQALYPDGKTIVELPYPRAKAHRQVPVAIRVMLAERARAIGAVADASTVA